MTMSIDRRSVLAGGLTLSAVALAGATPPRREPIYIGTQGENIYAVWFDAAEGALSLIGPAAQVERASWAVNHPHRPIVYFTQDSRDPTKGNGAVKAFRIDPANGTLNKWCEASTDGVGTTYLAFDRPSNTILGVNFGSAQIFALPVSGNGTLGEIASRVTVSGSGPNKRQASAHPHCVTLDPSGRWIVAADLGADRIWIFPFDRRSRKIGTDDPAASRHIALPAGAGPRHIAFHPNGRWLYLVEELSADVVVFGWNGKTGRLSQLQRLSTDPPGFAGTKSAAEITLSRDGRFLYVSNRSDHALVVHAVDSKTGQLNQIQRLPSGGTMPWHFAIHPSGRWLIVANRDSDNLALFQLDPKTGLLSDTGNGLSVPKPTFVSLRDT